MEHMKKAWVWVKTHKKISIVAVVVVVLLFFY